MLVLRRQVAWKCPGLPVRCPTATSGLPSSPSRHPPSAFQKAAALSAASIRSSPSTPPPVPDRSRYRSPPPPGRQGFGPDLTLSYDSGFGNGAFGLGWRLSLPTIVRKTDKGLPRYREGDEADVYILAGADDLVPLVDPAGDRSDPTRCRVYGSEYFVHRYRPRNEGAFAWIERWVSVDDPTDVFWRTISRDNVTTWFGRRPDSRIFDQADPTRIFEWSICERYDDRGNVVEYEYVRENDDGVDWSGVSEASRSPRSLTANSYIKHVRYGNVKPFRPSLAAGGGSWPAPTDDPPRAMARSNRGLLYVLRMAA
jgi:Salmonella virulence plasmid 65kDa B protein